MEFARYFRQHRRPRLFSDATTPRTLADRISFAHRSWRERTIESVERDRTVGLPIYATTGPKLAAGFPWGGVPPGPGGDVLYSVRPHRFAFAPRWALAVLYGAPVADEFCDVLEDWTTFAASTEDNPAYLSSLVVIQRVLALSWAWTFLAARPAESIKDDGLLEFRVLQILDADLRFLAPRLGSGYPNNHLLLERFAKWFGAAVWPELMPTNSLKHDEDLWLAELQRQTYEDGSGFEHSVHYHEYACEAALLYLRLCQVNGWEAPQPTIARVRSMLRFQAELGGPESVAIPIGGATEDPLLPLDSSERWGTGALREIYRVWFDRGLAQAPMDDPAIERAFWLLGGNLVESALSTSPAAPSVYRNGGFVVLPDTDSASRLTLRTGPAPGTSLSAGHMHADLLSIYLTVSSTPVIVDSGTYTYRGNGAAWPHESPAWRQYFAGPRAHNGPAIGDSDPLGALTWNFRPSASSARVRMSQIHPHGRLRWVEAEIESAGAYTGWRRGVIHLRDEYWLIYDLLPHDARPGDASIALQFPPEAVLSKRSQAEFAVSVGSVAVDVALSPELDRARVLVGETNPLGGWISRAYGHLQAAPQLRLESKAVKGLTAFVLKPARAPSILKLVTENLQGGFGLRVVCDHHIDNFLLSMNAQPARLRAWDIEFRGVLAWTRDGRARTEEAAWLNGQTLDWGTGSLTASRMVPMLEGRVTANGMQLSSLPQEAIHWVLRR